MANDKKEKQLLAVIDNFDLQTLTGDLAEAIDEEMDGLGSLPFDRVKIPSGGGLAFEIPGDDDDTPESATEIVGVILDHHPVNAYWPAKYAGGNEPPACSSYDGKQGIDRETGAIKECATCPYNQFGSDPATGGKACKNLHRVYILREGNPVPLILSLPPTSLKGFRDYIGKRIVLKGLRCWQAITKITLKKEKSAGGISYSRAVFSFEGLLSGEAQLQAAAMRECVINQYRQVSIDETDYTQTPAPKVDEDGFMNIPEGVEDAGLPFN